MDRLCPLDGWMVPFQNYEVYVHVLIHLHEDQQHFIVPINHVSS